jgi:hypothetical protein
MAAETSGSVLDRPPVPPEDKTAIGDSDGGSYVDTGIRLAQIHANDGQDPAAQAAPESTVPPVELVGGTSYTFERARDLAGRVVVDGWNSGVLIESDPNSNTRRPLRNSVSPPVLGAAALFGIGRSRGSQGLRLRRR